MNKNLNLPRFLQWIGCCRQPRVPKISLNFIPLIIVFRQYRPRRLSILCKRSKLCTEKLAFRKGLIFQSGQFFEKIPKLLPLTGPGPTGPTQVYNSKQSSHTPTVDYSTVVIATECNTQSMYLFKGRLGPASSLWPKTAYSVEKKFLAATSELLGLCRQWPGVHRFGNKCRFFHVASLQD